MKQGTAKLMSRLAGSATEVGSYLKRRLGRISHWLYRLLARGRRLERVSVNEIRAIGASLRREPLPPAAENSSPPPPVALTSDAQQALKHGLKGGAKLKNEM